MNQVSKLNLGSGKKRIVDAINVDKMPGANPDVVHDLDCIPWPFPESCFDEVIAYDVIEHLENTVQVMEEIQRVSKDGAKVKITVPHFSCSNAFTDPTHKHQFGWFSFHYFTGENDTPLSSKTRFTRLNSRIIFFPSLLNKIVWRLANKWPETYERRWTWILPAWFLYFELQVSKEPASP